MLRRLPALAACLLATAILAAPRVDAHSGHTSYSAEQTELDELYQKLLNHLHGEPIHRKRMINTQRAWVAFRDAECEYITTHGQNERQHVETYDQCATSMTNTRIRALEHYLQCIEVREDCRVEP